MMTSAVRCGIEAVFGELDEVISGVSFEGFSFWLKDDHSFVTSLDIELQERIVAVIRSYFPDHGILCEEGDEKFKRSSGYLWIVDPIDGTGNLIKGGNEFAVSVGLMYGTSFICAYVNFIRLSECYTVIGNTPVLRNRLKYDVQNGIGEQGEIILCSKTFSSLREPFGEKGFDTECYYCATYSMLKLQKGEALAYHTIHTNLYDVGPMSFILNNLGIPCYNERLEVLTYKPELKKIPFFLAARHPAVLELFANGLTTSGSFL